MFNPRKFLTKTQNPKNTLQRLLTNDEKLEFVKTSVSWISGKDIMDTCFILNFGYEAPLPWPQVYVILLIRISYFISTIQVRMKLDNETYGMDVPIACSIVIIAGE